MSNNSTKVCSVDDCRELFRARSRCMKHYRDYRASSDFTFEVVQHGLSKTRAYSIRKCMLSRCYNKNNSEYFRYGGRGIAVCKRWRESVENFVGDMGEPPQGYSIDRIDNNGNYEPGNCRWATQTQQNRNYNIVPRNKTGYHGIYEKKTGRRFISSIMVRNKKIHIGCYETFEEALSARLAAECIYWDS